MSFYREYIIETFLNPGEPSASRIRARPLQGQGVPTSWRVECSRPMRHSHPVGTLFLLMGRAAGGDLEAPFLYCNPRANYKVVSREEANEIIRTRFASGA